jgi:hypothetical protein
MFRFLGQAGRNALRKGYFRLDSFTNQMDAVRLIGLSELICTDTGDGECLGEAVSVCEDTV